MSEFDEAGDADVRSDLLPLDEKAIRTDGTAAVRIIAPGWGSSGYYSREMLQRDGPRVFTSGLHMYLDHPTTTEDAGRPERSLRDLAGVLVSPARWDEAGAGGPGLYADAQVFSPFREIVEEIAPYIGVSIRALGKAAPGEAEGRSGPIIEELTQARSVDFVTAPGAGGKVLQLFESARGAAPKEADNMDELKEAMAAAETARRERDEARAAVAEAQRAAEARAAVEKERDTELARLREAALLRDARDITAQALAKVARLPDVTRARLTESAAANPPVKDGALDREALAARVDEQIKAEVEYLAKALGAGRITGMGPDGGGADAGAAHAVLESAFGRLMGDETLAKIAANGRV